MKYILIGLLFFTTPVNAQQTDNEVREAIGKQNDIYERGYAERNVKMIASVHTENAQVYAPNRPVYTGRAGVIKMAEEDFAITNSYILELTNISLEVHGDTAIDTGEYVAHLTLKDMSSIKDTGHYIVIWKKQADGRWLYDKDIYNSRETLPY